MRPPRGGPLAFVVVVVLAGTVLAGAAEPAAARTRSDIEFRPVLTELLSVAETPPTTARVDLTSAKTTIASCDVTAVSQLAAIPTTRSSAAAAGACAVFPERPGGKQVVRYYLGPAALTGRTIAHARAEFVSGQGWTVKLELTKAGSEAWDRLATAQFHRQVAIVLDGQVQSAPTIQPDEQTFSSFGGVLVVSGAFTQKQAGRLAALANAGRGRSRRSAAGR